MNPTSDDFKWKVHGKEYQLNAGKSAEMPGFIAWLYVYNQSVKAAEAAGEWIRWNEEGFRQTYYDRFTVGVADLVQVVQDEPEPEVTVFGDTTITANEPEAPKRGRPATTK